MLELALNELSLEDKAPDDTEARHRLKNLRDLLGETANRVGAGRNLPLRTDSNLITQEIAPGDSIATSINDDRINLDDRNYLIGILSQPPFTDKGLKIEEDDARSSLEVKYKDREATGFLFAFKEKGMAISLNSSQEWDASLIEISFSSLNDNGEIDDSTPNIQHAAKLKHLDEHATWLKDIRNSIMSDGKALIKNQESLFPHIKFCGKSEEQISGILDDNKLRSLILSLNMINEYSRNWQNGDSNINKLQKYGLMIRQESQPTLNMFSEERTFNTSTGPKLFSLHFSINPGAWRAYIELDPASPMVQLAYVGPHLSTQRFR